MSLTVWKRSPKYQSEILKILLNEKEEGLRVQKQFVKRHVNPRVRSVSLKVLAHPTGENGQAY